jgi:hypothetical protein
MKLNDDVDVLALPVDMNGQPRQFSPTLILDAARGPTLVDSGLSGQAAALGTALAEAGGPGSADDRMLSRRGGARGSERPAAARRARGRSGAIRHALNHPPAG